MNEVSVWVAVHNAGLSVWFCEQYEWFWCGNSEERFSCTAVSVDEAVDVSASFLFSGI
mgnify:CR=1 FL=1